MYGNANYYLDRRVDLVEFFFGEMQASPTNELHKRSRYYQGMIDLNLIERGAYFKELKRSFVIFICLEDHFNSDLPIYTFENVCLENRLIQLNDEAIKIFINADCKTDNLSPQIKEFFNYLKTQEPTGKLTQHIAGNVQKVASNEKWRLEYMTFQMKLNEVREEGKLLMIKEMIDKKMITLKQAAKAAKMSIRELSLALRNIDSQSEVR